MKKPLFALLLLLTTAFGARPAPEPPFFFIQMSDPQLGMFRADTDYVQDAANFEFAIATANRLHPAFVIITGDLINKPGDPAQIAEYKRITAKLDKSIPLYNVPGNHDVRNTPTPASIATYTRAFGPDQYVFHHGNFTGIVLNSTVIDSSVNVPQEFAAQESWLRNQLAAASESGARHIVVFQHHPWFLSNPTEPDQYFNIPLVHRERYLAMFRQYGVEALFSGHYHQNAVSADGKLPAITTGPVGMPFGDKPQSGFRIVTVTDAGITHQFVGFENLPKRITVK
ncbi:MAG: metallophosphoesterase [Gemmatimonadota bacterium]